MNKNLYILSATRTPMTSLLGEQKDLSASQLGAVAIKGAVERAGLNPETIDQVIMGCVLTAGQGQAPARQAAIKAALPTSVPAITVNKMCGSGMQAMMFGGDSILANQHHIVVTGGMESMTNAPYLTLKSRQGYRLGHGKLYDHMFLDGLEDAYQQGKLMGCFADDCARVHHFDRKTQDDFALNSLKKAQTAIAKGDFTSEITPTTKANGSLITIDEQPSKAKPEKIPLLKPAFSLEGTVTAANSSSISDGAAALVLCDDEGLKLTTQKPLARIVGYTSFAAAPEWFSTAPVGAIQKLLKQIDWSIDQVDLFEINEAFAVVALYAAKTLKIDVNKLNVHGGACALGHPIGASGARIIVTLIYALKKLGLKRGIASACIGGGEATAMAIELC